MNSSKNWQLLVEPSIDKALKKIPRRDTDAILAVIRLLPLDPYFGDIKHMHGRPDVLRRRIGAYRLFFQIRESERAIVVFHIERRTSKTY